MRRLMITLAVVALPFGGAVACGGSEEEERKKANVSFLAFGDPEEIKAFRDVIAAYKEEDPDTTVQLIEASDRDDLLARLGTSFAGGTPPDLFLINYRFYGQYAARDVLEPVAERVADSDAFRGGGLLPAGDGCVPLGRRAHLPAAEHLEPGRLLQPRRFPAATACRSRRRAGPGTRWSRAAAKLTKNVDGKGRFELYGLGVEPSVIRTAPFVWSNGGDIVDDPDDADPPDLRPAAGARGAAQVLRAPPGAPGHPDRDRGRVRGRRDALRQRAARDAALLPPRHADVPHDRGLRLGRRAAAACTLSRRASSTRTRTA